MVLDMPGRYNISMVRMTSKGLTNERMYELYSRLSKDSHRISGDRHRKVLPLAGTSGILTMRD